MSLIKCEKLSLSYESMEVINDLSFEINRGDYVCILGENGSGKSTLMKAILGLKKPSSGSIEFGDGLVQNEIGYIPQQTIAQKDFPATVMEVVMSGFLNQKGFRVFYNFKEKQKAKEIMEKLDIYALRKRSYRELSGGQQQRVLIARALCATGKLIVLDEPVAGLDYIMTKQLYKIIEELNLLDKITIIMVSHDMDAALKYATHILHIHKDSIFYGAKEDYLTCPTCKIVSENEKEKGTNGNGDNTDNVCECCNHEHN